MVVFGACKVVGKVVDIFAILVNLSKIVPSVIPGPELSFHKKNIDMSM